MNELPEFIRERLKGLIGTTREEIVKEGIRVSLNTKLCEKHLEKFGNCVKCISEAGCKKLAICMKIYEKCFIIAMASGDLAMGACLAHDLAKKVIADNPEKKEMTTKIQAMYEKPCKGESGC